MAGAVSSYSYKRKLLLSQMLLMTAAAAFVHTLLDAYQLQFKILPINVSVVGWLLILYRLNNKGYHNFARYTSVISVSLILLVLGGMTPEENGLHLLYLPLMCVGFIIFDHDQYWSKISICLFIFACYLVLEFTSFRPLESLPMLEEKERASFVTNFITSGVLLFLVLSYIARANHKAEQHLQQMAMEMQAQNQQLSKANEELDRFVYSTSHDLRAPLLSILGLVQLLETNPQWLELDNILLARAFSLLEQNMFSHLHTTARQRFEALLSTNPAIFNHVPLQHIASMLGITPETLSRLRKSLSDTTS